ncbi:hypothetical protein MRX96_044238 [Rhipicephalus microplus]
MSAPAPPDHGGLAASNGCVVLIDRARGEPRHRAAVSMATDATTALGRCRLAEEAAVGRAKKKKSGSVVPASLLVTDGGPKWLRTDAAVLGPDD